MTTTMPSLVLDPNATWIDNFDTVVDYVAEHMPDLDDEDFLEAVETIYGAYMGMIDADS